MSSDGTRVDTMVTLSAESSGNEGVNTDNRHDVPPPKNSRQRDGSWRVNTRARGWVPVETGTAMREFKYETGATRSRMPTFTDIGRAAYCPRQLYYARRDGDDGPPAEARARQRLAFRYPALRAASEAELRVEPIAVTPATYREALDGLARREDWAALVDPRGTHVSLTGKDCRGRVHKLLDTAEGTVPALVSPGAPPERGVWEPQQVRAVAAAKALAWEQEREPPHALVEYPAHAVVRTVRLTTRAKAAYRRALRAVRSLDGPPPRLRNTTKCRACAYQDRCGVETRSMRSLLGR